MKLNGAVEKTRTSTPVKEQRPQRCASTNSATTALETDYALPKSNADVKSCFYFLIGGWIIEFILFEKHQ